MHLSILFLIPFLFHLSPSSFLVGAPPPSACKQQKELDRNRNKITEIVEGNVDIASVICDGLDIAKVFLAAAPFYIGPISSIMIDMFKPKIPTPPSKELACMREISEQIAKHTYLIIKQMEDMENNVLKELHKQYYNEHISARIDYIDNLYNTAFNGDKIKQQELNKFNDTCTDQQSGILKIALHFSYVFLGSCTELMQQDKSFSDKSFSGDSSKKQIINNEIRGPSDNLRYDFKTNKFYYDKNNQTKRAKREELTSCLPTNYMYTKFYKLKYIMSLVNLIHKRAIQILKLAHICGHVIYHGGPDSNKTISKLYNDTADIVFPVMEAFNKEGISKFAKINMERIAQKLSPYLNLMKWPGKILGEYSIYNGSEIEELPSDYIARVYIIEYPYQQETKILCSLPWCYTSPFRWHIDRRSSVYADIMIVQMPKSMEGLITNDVVVFCENNVISEMNQLNLRTVLSDKYREAYQFYKLDHFIAIYQNPCKEGKYFHPFVIHSNYTYNQVTFDTYSGSASYGCAKFVFGINRTEVYAPRKLYEKEYPPPARMHGCESNFMFDG